MNEKLNKPHFQSEFKRLCLLQKLLGQILVATPEIDKFSQEFQNEVATNISQCGLTNCDPYFYEEDCTPEENADLYADTLDKAVSELTEMQIFL